MRLHFKEEEIRKRTEQAIFKVAKRGEPLDPEMLNPRRKRPPIEVSPLFFWAQNQGLLFVSMLNS